MQNGAPQETNGTPQAPIQSLPRSARRARIRAALLFTDAAMLLLATHGASLLRFGGNLFAHVSFEGVEYAITYFELSFVVTAVWLASLWLDKLYDLDRLSWGSGELRRVVRALSTGVVFVILLTYALNIPGLSRAWTVVSWILAVLLVMSGRMTIRWGITRLRRSGRLARPTLIVGSNAEAADIARIIGSDTSTGLILVGCLASSQADRLSLDFLGPDLPCLGTARDVRSIAESQGVDTVIIVSSAFDHDVLARMINELRGMSVDINVSSGLFEVLTSRVLVREVSGVPLITVKGVSLSKSNLLTKRAFDIVVAGAVIAVGLPVWLVVIALIKLTSRGPIFYQQERIGEAGRAFGMYKFRSMVADADKRLGELEALNEATGPMFKIARDPRVTAVGHWLRKFSIDEIPQLINVLKGEMSLVGPRPPLPREVVQYTHHDWRRMEVPPGMTGLWQVSGRSRLTFDEMVRLDLFYIENWSVGLDVALLLRTIPAVFAGEGAY